MNNLDICYLVFNSKNNGGNRIIFDQGNRLSKRGHIITFLILKGQKPKWIKFDENIKFFGFRQIFTRHEILVASFWPTAYLSLFLRAKKKYYFIQGWEIDFYKNIFLKLAVRISLYFKFTFITTSNYLEKNLKHFNIKQKIYNTKGIGINPIFFKSKKRELVKNKKIIRILSVVSSYSYAKGIDQLSRIINILKKKSNKYRFILVSGENKPYANIFDEFISNANPTQMVKAYKSADILLSVSRSEGFSLPVIEAMAIGCPVIATDSGGINDFAKNNNNCIVIKNVNEILDENLIEKLQKNKKLYRQLSRNGINTAKTYNWDRFITKLEKIFNSK